MNRSLVVVAAVALAACSSGGTPMVSTAAIIPTNPTATALVRDGNGRTLGTLTLTETGAGLVTTGTLRGLAPGAHGIHVHTVGNCDSAGFTSAGGHWNPAMRMHGFDNPMGPHMGDMRNISVGGDSVATVNTITAGGTLRGAAGLLDADGASVVVHAGADDYRSDPAGNSGARVACGVVTQ